MDEPSRKRTRSKSRGSGEVELSVVSDHLLLRLHPVVFLACQERSFFFYMKVFVVFFVCFLGWSGTWWPTHEVSALQHFFVQRTAMDNHRVQLAVRCRVCGKKSEKGRSQRAVAGLEFEIVSVFGVDVRQDEGRRHSTN